MVAALASMVQPQEWRSPSALASDPVSFRLAPGLEVCGLNGSEGLPAQDRGLTLRVTTSLIAQGVHAGLGGPVLGPGRSNMECEPIRAQHWGTELPLHSGWWISLEKERNHLIASLIFMY